MEANFFGQMDEVFKGILDVDKGKIIVVDSETEKPIPGVKYDKMLFDSELNMFKIDNEGKIVPITNPKFKAILKS